MDKHSAWPCLHTSVPVTIYESAHSYTYVWYDNICIDNTSTATYKSDINDSASRRGVHLHYPARGHTLQNRAEIQHHGGRNQSNQPSPD